MDQRIWLLSLTAIRYYTYAKSQSYSKKLWYIEQGICENIHHSKTGAYFTHPPVYISLHNVGCNPLL